MKTGVDFRLLFAGNEKVRLMQLLPNFYTTVGTEL
jgi:hypothetical protein